MGGVCTFKKMVLVLFHRGCAAAVETEAGQGHSAKQVRAGVVVLTRCAHTPWEMTSCCRDQGPAKPTVGSQSIGKVCTCSGAGASGSKADAFRRKF